MVIGTHRTLRLWHLCAGPCAYVAYGDQHTQDLAPTVIGVRRTLRR
jgi:hypothetical protein